MVIIYLGGRELFIYSPREKYEFKAPPENHTEQEPGFNGM